MPRRKTTAKPSVPMSDSYPHLCRWVAESGTLEIGHDQATGSFIRVLDEGGMIWKGRRRYPSLDAALAQPRFHHQWPPRTPGVDPVDFEPGGEPAPGVRAALTALGYSVAYPFGFIAPFLCMYFANLWLKQKVLAPTGPVFDLREVVVRNRQVIGRPLAQVSAELPAGVRIFVVRQGNRKGLPLGCRCRVTASSGWSRRIRLFLKLWLSLDPECAMSIKSPHDTIYLIEDRRKVVARSVAGIETEGFLFHLDRFPSHEGRGCR